MEIGKILKNYRIDRNLTQKEFAADIFSHSFYSKIESGEHHIRADDLFELLRYHSISLDAFYDLYTSGGEKSYQTKLLEKSIMMASYSGEIERFPIILEEIDASILSESTKKRTIAQTKLVWATVAKDPSLLSKEEKNDLKEYIFTKEEWSNDWLALLSNSFSLFDLIDITLLIQTILTKELKEPAKIEFNRLILLYTLCINFSYKCLRENAEDFIYFPMNYLEQIPDHFYFILQKAHTQFIKRLMQYRAERKTETKERIFEIIYQFESLDMAKTAVRFKDLWEELKTA